MGREGIQYFGFICKPTPEMQCFLKGRLRELLVAPVLRGRPFITVPLATIFSHDALCHIFHLEPPSRCPLR